MVHVYVDTTVQVNIPRVAVVATRFIKAMDEITMDYHPRFEGYTASRARQEGLTCMIPCSCSSRNCRQYYYFGDP